MVSLAPFVLRRPWLTKMLTPAASWYANAAGYRKLGLRYEDLSTPPKPAIVRDRLPTQRLLGLKSCLKRSIELVSKQLNCFVSGVVLILIRRARHEMMNDGRDIYQGDGEFANN